MGFFPALAANMLQMVGVGPFITIPLILAAMGGPQALAGWVLGALLALCDGLVWAELGAAMPGTGGSYDYLQRAFGANGLGKLMGFLFLWQVMLVAPLTAASGGVGFADYAQYLAPSMTPGVHRFIAVAVCLAATALLYREIRSIGKISTILWAVLMLVIAVIVFSGAMHFNAAQAFHFSPDAFRLTPAFFTGLGAATLLSMYDYSGYFTVCLIGGEVKDPAVNIPRAVIASISILAVVYIAMSLSVIGVLPWQEAMRSQAVVADFMARIYGSATARALTVLILVVAFASVFAVLLGFTRVPYAAAVEGKFFKPFARVHPTKHFPAFSVLFLGGLSAFACLFPLESLIKEMIILQILTQFAAQCVAVFLLRHKRREIPRPFSMPWYPLPVIAALLGWLYVLSTGEAVYVLIGLAMVAVGVAAYLLRARNLGEWPWNPSPERE